MLRVGCLSCPRSSDLRREGHRRDAAGIAGRVGGRPEPAQSAPCTAKRKLRVVENLVLGQKTVFLNIYLQFFLLKTVVCALAQEVAGELWGGMASSVRGRLQQPRAQGLADRLRAAATLWVAGGQAGVPGDRIGFMGQTGVFSDGLGLGFMQGEDGGPVEGLALHRSASGPAGTSGWFWLGRRGPSGPQGHPAVVSTGVGRPPGGADSGGAMGLKLAHLNLGLGLDFLGDAGPLPRERARWEVGGIPGQTPGCIRSHTPWHTYTLPAAACAVGPAVTQKHPGTGTPFLLTRGGCLGRFLLLETPSRWCPLRAKRFFHSVAGPPPTPTLPLQSRPGWDGNVHTWKIRCLCRLRGWGLRVQPGAEPSAPCPH